MINAEIVYKIKLIGLNPAGGFWDKDAWVQGYNVVPKTGGSGKTFTSKTLVNRMFTAIASNSRYGSDYRCEIVTFELTQVASTPELLD